MKSFYKFLAAMLATATITFGMSGCDQPTYYPEQAPDKAGSMTYDTDQYTVEGEGYFVARGSGDILAVGDGTALVQLDDGNVNWYNCELVQQRPNFWHIKTLPTEGEIDITGTGEALLQGSGIVYYEGTGFEFHYRY
tara:strand:- start:739 stop:1149 length:411 start_codon:yes stop_codon:yes gene_type:complete